MKLIPIKMMFSENKLKGPKGREDLGGFAEKLDRKGCRLNQVVIQLTPTKLNV